MTGGSKEMVSNLLRVAGLSAHGARVRVLPSPGVINNHSLIELANGRRFVVREYAWPFRDPITVDRQAKEEWLLPILEREGIPAPRLIARVDGAILTTFVEGRLLATTREPEAWRATGETLRRAHEVEMGPHTGVVVAGGVEPFREGTWGQWNAAMARLHGSAVARSHLDEIEQIFELALPILDAAPVRLSHNDAHPWNALDNGTWLDWEFALAADPDWDLARSMLMRITDIGPTPDSFWEGYGRGIDPVRLAVYELHYHLWRANEQRDVVRAWHSGKIALQFVALLGHHLPKLKDMLT